MNKRTAKVLWYKATPDLLNALEKLGFLVIIVEAF